MALIDSLASYWSFDSDGTDAVGSNDLTLNNSSNVSGLISNAESFNASNGDGVKTSASGINTGTGPISVSMWLKGSIFSAGPYYFIFEAGNTGAGSDYVMSITSGGDDDSCIMLIGDGSTSLTGDINTSINATTFTHFVFTRTGADWEVYEDGSLLDSGSFTSRTATASDGVSLHSNIAGASNPSVAHVFDEVGVWNKILSSAEVTSLYNGGSGLAYPFSSGTDMQINIGDAWKDVEALQINIGDVWKTVEGAQINIGDVWKEVY